MVVPDTTFRTWLKNTEGVEISKTTLTVSAESIFAIEMLSQRLNTTINEALLQTSNKKLNLKYILNGINVNQTQYINQGEIRGTWSNPKYNFNSFISGKSNFLPYAASKKICELPGETYNPYYIYANWGLGKTHLAQAIAKNLKTKGFKVVSSTGESFTNEFVKSVRTNNPKIMEKYREADAFILDDLDFLVGKKQTIEMLIHIMNQLAVSGKQIVLTSYNHPSKTHMPSRLISMIKSGLIVKINAPDTETTRKYIYKKLKSKKISISENVLDYISNKKFQSISEIEGIINTLIAHSDLLNSTINKEMVKSIIRDYKLDDLIDQTITEEKVFSCINYLFGIQTEDLQSRKNDRKTNFARQVAAYLLIEKSNFTTSQAGLKLGKRDHSTIIYSVNKIKKELLNNVELKQEIEKSLSLN